MIERGGDLDEGPLSFDRLEDEQHQRPGSRVVAEDVAASVVRPATDSLEPDDGAWLEFYAAVCSDGPDRTDGRRFENLAAPNLSG